MTPGRRREMVDELRGTPHRVGAPSHSGRFSDLRHRIGSFEKTCNAVMPLRRVGSSTDAFGTKAEIFQ